MAIRVLPLGINGFIPSFGRQTMSVLILTESETLLLDAGTGVARFLDPSVMDLVRPYDCLNVILSHYHLDHVVGLSYLNGIQAWKRIRIYGPGKPFADVEPDQALHRLIHPPFYPVTLRDFPTPVEIIPLKEEALQIGTLSIQVQAQNHPGGSMGIRIGDSVAYVTDTPVLQATESFVRGVRLLLHETWLTDAEAETDEVERSRHSSVSPVAQLSKQAKVGHLMPIHHHPRRPDAEIREIVKSMESLAGIEVFVPEEGRIWEVD